MATKEEEYKKLRSYLNKSIRGKNTEIVLKSLAPGPVHLINNVEAVNDSLYIVSAKEKFLDQKLGDRGVVRPTDVGLADDIFREIGIETINRSQVRDLVHQLLRIIYGEIFTRATSPALGYQPYALENGDNLIISFDDSDPVEVVFSSSQFQNINSASAQEVADAITKSIRKIGKTGAAFVRQDDGDSKIVLTSSSDGPSSSVKVLGGKAQNILKFDEIRPTSADGTTKWLIKQQAGGGMRATWSGGASPSLGKIKVGDYVNIYGTAFDPMNRGTFTITAAVGGNEGESYFEFENPNGINQGVCSVNPTINTSEQLCSLDSGVWNSSGFVTQGTSDAILFFNPRKRTLTTNNRYAAAFQTSPRTIEIYMPATTKVVRRNRKGAAHIYGDNTPSASGQESPYAYDSEVNYTISEKSALTTEVLNINSNSILLVNDSGGFPDEIGSLMIGLGTSHQEGPIQYISTPSNETIRINPSYKFKKEHPIGTDVALISKLSSPSPNRDGTDLPFFLTDSIAGRVYAEDIIKQITATGIVVIIYILYPNDEGLGNYHKDSSLSEKYYIWGTLEDL